VLETGQSAGVLLDGVPAAAQLERRANQQLAISTLMPVMAGQSRTHKVFWPEFFSRPKGYLPNRIVAGRHLFDPAAACRAISKWVQEI
jgi:hypothetical protein